MTRKPIAIKPVLPCGFELNMNGPDFSKLHCEQPLPDVATIVLRAKDDADAAAAHQNYVLTQTII